MVASGNQAERFFRDFHSRQPAATPAVYDVCKTKDGLTSYHVLAQVIPTYGTVVDLGCGDGRLLEYCLAFGHRHTKLCGIDLSSHSLKRAAERPRLAEVMLCRGRAQQLPFDTATVDHLAAHLVLMLIDPLSPALREIARVLKPGGTVNAMMGGGPAVTQTPNAVEVFIDTLVQCFPKESDHAPRFTDPRLRRKHGLVSILAESRFFDDVSMEHLHVAHTGHFDTIWRMLTTQYECGALSVSMHETLRHEFRRRCQRHWGDDTAITVTWALRRVQARRRRGLSG